MALNAEEIDYVVALIMGWIEGQIDEKGDSAIQERLTDQYGTQLDPPAHFYEFGATISDLPATYSIRPLVVIDIHEKVEKDPGYHATIEDIKAWEAKYGKIPEGSVVAILSSLLCR